jgi:molybdopterin synthase sulfur carrier subunit
MVRVLLFGKLRDIAGWRERVCDPSPATLFDLRSLICASDPTLAMALTEPGVQTAVDRVLQRGDIRLPEGSEVAFMPAMSGG